MTQFDGDQTPADVTWVAERLEQERPMATPLELDRIKVRVRKQAMRGGSRAKGSFLKSRVAITAILMLGLVCGGTGTGLAVTDPSGSAAQRQYPSGNVLGQTERQGGGGGGGGVLGTTESSGGGSVQGSQQVTATETGSDLPFTGLAAVPLIVLGLGLIVAGGLLYRSARRDPMRA